MVGQNIANASTTGYVQEELQLVPAPTSQDGKVLVGTGVQVQGVVEDVDQYLEQRLRGR